MAVAGILTLSRPAAPASLDPVPTTHWAYDAVLVLAQGGVFTGFPDGTFQGRRPVSRADFAIAVRTMLGDTLRRAGAGDSRWYFRRASDGPANIRLLIREFAPELAEQGVRPRAAAEAADVFSERWMDPKPEGITAPMPGVRMSDSLLVWPEDPSLQQIGAEAARRELQAGDPSLWYLPYGKPPANPTGALPLRPAAGTSRREQIQQLIGHNRAVWDALLKADSPYQERWTWLADAGRPQAAWKRGKPLRMGHEPLSVGDGHVLRLSGVNCVGPIWDVLLDDREMDNPLAHCSRLWILPCAPGSEVAIFSAGARGGRLYVIELRTGCVLSVWPQG